MFFLEKEHVLFFSNMLFLNSVEKKVKLKIFIAIYTFFLKPVFKVNIYNLPQFVNHTVALVQNKNKERISLE